MTRYARSVNFNGQKFITDIVDMAVYTPRPSWGQTDDALLSKIFANHKDEWTAAGEWFFLLPDDTVTHWAIDNGDGTYKNQPPNPIPILAVDGTLDYKATMQAQAAAMVKVGLAADAATLLKSIGQ